MELKRTPLVIKKIVGFCEGQLFFGVILMIDVMCDNIYIININMPKATEK